MVLEFNGKHLKKVLVAPIRLPQLKVSIDITAENDGARRREFLIASAELAGLHIIFQHADAGLCVVEAGVGDLVEKDQLLEADDAKLARSFVVEK